MATIGQGRYETFPISIITENPIGQYRCTAVEGTHFPLKGHTAAIAWKQSQWVSLHSNKTLFTKIGRRPDLARGELKIYIIRSSLQDLNKP
jgi:hypothetical protein